jgi:homoserine dehydrogenase
VVTANKALLAERGRPLFEAATRTGKNLLFEAAVAGGIPIIRTLKEGLAANRIQRIQGILNGTCNYILTKMTSEGTGFEEVLKEAQALGYAEADPTFDIDGHDSAHKVAILAALSFGVQVDFSKVYVEGIRRITPLDIQFAREFGYRIKLLGLCTNHNGEIEARVHPAMIPQGHMLANVGRNNNALLVTGDAVGDVLLYGAGAGSLPTAGAVVGDLMELARDILRGSSGRVPCMGFLEENIAPARIKPMEEILSRYYFRIHALDRPGVLSAVSGILARYGISIASVIQKERRNKGWVPVVMMTHRALERDVKAALLEIDELEQIGEATMMIRVEDENERESEV